MDFVWTKSRAELYQKLAALPAVLAGLAPDPTGTLENLLLRMGVTALVLIQQNFVVLAAGGVGADGDQWRPLLPETVAYRRRHGKLQKQRARAKQAGRASRPLLSSAQDRLWRRIFTRELYFYEGQGADRKTSRAIAAAVAWRTLKQMGAKTILEEYGKESVQILRDTGMLLSSLSPGQGTEPSGAYQILRAQPGLVTVGTNRPGAYAHHKGTTRLPKRALWPDGQNWPEDWLLEVALSLLDGFSAYLVRYLAA